MAWTIIRWSHISRKERRTLDDVEIKLIIYHEEHHRKHWWRISSKADEKEALMYSFKKLLAEGHKLEKIILAECNTRLLIKYGITIDEIKNVFA